MRLQVGGGLDDVEWTCHPAHPPAGHGVGLGHTVDYDAAIDEVGDQNRHGRELRVAVNEVLVDLIGHDPQALGGSPFSDGLDLGGGVDSAGGIGRRDEDKDLGLGCARGLKLRNVGAIAGRLICHDNHGCAACQQDGFGVGGPVRRLDYDLIARIQQRGEGVVKGLLASVGDQHLGGRQRESRVAKSLGSDGLAKFGQAGRRGVAVPFGVLAGCDGRIDHVRGGRKVGLTGTKPDHRAPGGLEGLGLGVNGQGG